MNKNELNYWEELFLEFLDMTEFYLRQRVDENDELCYGLEDGQHANLADIESEFFYSAASILDRMETYEYDYIVRDLEECAHAERISLQYQTWSDWLQYKEIMPKNQGNFAYIDMICNHSLDIDIDKVYKHITA